MKRVFLVGCPRSGTTLLQSRLATHPCVESFPESFFYNYFVPSKKILANLGIASRWCKPKFLEFLENIDRKDLAPIFMPWTISIECIDKNIRILTHGYCPG
ncbi:MAG: sulfotransferase, partial [Bacteroidota bacterium]